jgi:NAD(P)-dependent dehydrogenase (short-subunit alcohol dehydrogenase family)
MADPAPVALVIGGARGVGAEVVRALADRGHAIAIHCHASLREARALAAELAAAGSPALAVTANLREEGAVRALVHRVADHFGRLDVVVSCARLRLAGRFEALSVAELASHYEVNVIGPFVVAQEAAAVMLAQESGGVIVALAESGDPRPDELASFTSQAAIPALMQALDTECQSRRPRVRAGCVIMPSPPPPPTVLAATLLARIDELRAAPFGVGPPGLS